MFPSSSPSGLEPGRSDAPSKQRYTCFIRLPFPRNGFQDPPSVEWNANKDKALWKVISKSSHSGNMDWSALSESFGVTLPFLLQQAAWLTERHLEGMRKQMQKLGSGGSGAASPASPIIDSAGGSTNPGSDRLKVTARRLSNVLTKAPLGQHDEFTVGSTPPHSPRAELSRTPSTTTVTQSRLGNYGKQPAQRPYRGSNSSQRRPQLQLDAIRPTDEEGNNSEGSSAVDDQESSESESDDEPVSMARSQAFRRAPTSKKPGVKRPKDAALDEEEEDDEEEADGDNDESDSPGSFLPFAVASKAAPHQSRLKSSSSPPKSSSRQNIIPKNSAPPPTFPHAALESSASSSSSAAPRPAMLHNRNVERRGPGPLSPQQRAQLASLSPRSRREKSDGSPSMGSSFSDLDDLSVTQSALEEALLSMQQQHSASTSMASRVSSFRDALKRR